MSTQTDSDLELFEGSIYDIEGTPELNGRKATTVMLSIDPHKLDRSSVDDMELASRLEPGEEIRLTVVATVSRRGWSEDPKEGVQVTHRLKIVDIA